MSIYCKEYLEEINDFSKSLDKGFLFGKSIVISGATGLICSYLIDGFLIDSMFNIKIIALVLSLEDGQTRFSKFQNDPRLIFVVANVVNPILIECKVDYIIHGASYTDPRGYAEHPIDTMLINFNGVKNMLDLAVKHHSSKLLFMSTCEIYGEADIDNIPEEYSGYLDTMDVRSCYNEGKRASETLCVCYSKEKQVPIVIPRFSRCFGPTMRINDTKALSQFLKNVLNDRDVVLKSDGKQKYSYIYVADAASAIVFLLKMGNDGQAYNVANPEILELRDIAFTVARSGGKKVVFDFPVEEQLAYSKVTRAIQSIEKISNLGWSSKISISAGILSTLRIMKVAYFSDIDK